MFVFFSDSNSASGWGSEGLVEVAADSTGAARPGMQRFMKGSYRFGRYTKNLLSKDNLFGEVLLICNAHPSVGQLNTVAGAVRKELEAAVRIKTCLRQSHHSIFCDVFTFSVYL